MDGEKDKLSCPICLKQFTSVSTKYRHMRNIHHQDLNPKQLKHIKCPICPEEKKIGLESHNALDIHLEQIHSINIITSQLTFKNEAEFEAWRALENRSVDYVKRRYRKSSDGLVIYFECNRSNYSGYVSQCSKRSMKTGGSIRISGFCPSRIRVKISSTDVNVTFVKTHVGHEDELRSKRLSKDEQKLIADKLEVGITMERILQDSKNVTEENLQRINVLTRADLSYIMRKFNIDKRRHDDDMVDTALKVEEWNTEGRKVDDDSDDNSYICEPSTSRSAHETDVQSVIDQSSKISNFSIDSDSKFQMELDQSFMKLISLHESDIRRIMKLIDEAHDATYGTGATSRKRKMEKQLYFPRKK